MKRVRSFLYACCFPAALANLVGATSASSTMIAVTQLILGSVLLLVWVEWIKKG